MEQVQATYQSIQTSQPYAAAYYGVPTGGQQVVAQPLQQYYLMSYMGQQMQGQGQGQAQPQYLAAPTPNSPAANYQQPQVNGYLQGAQMQQHQQLQQQQYASQLQQPVQQQIIQQTTQLTLQQQQQQQQPPYQKQQNVQVLAQREANGLNSINNNNNNNNSALQIRQYDNRVEFNGKQNNMVELNRANTMSSSFQEGDNNNVRRSKSEQVWGEYGAESPKSVAKGGAGGGGVSEMPQTKTTLNPHAVDFVPNKPPQAVTQAPYRQRHQNGGYQHRMQNRDRQYIRGYNNNNNNYNNYNRGYNGRRGGNYMKSGVNNMRQFPSDSHQSARKRVKQCVNRVRDLLDNFANNNQLDAFYPDDQDSHNYFEALTNLSTQMLEEIDHIIAQTN